MLFLREININAVCIGLIAKIILRKQDALKLAVFNFDEQYLVNPLNIHQMLIWIMLHDMSSAVVPCIAFQLYFH